MSLRASRASFYVHTQVETEALGFKRRFKMKQDFKLIGTPQGKKRRDHESKAELTSLVITYNFVFMEKIVT